MRLLEARTLVTVSSSEGVAKSCSRADSWLGSALLVAKSGGKEVSHIEKNNDLYIDKLQIYMLGSPLLAPPSRALDLTGGLQAGHLSPENLDLSALGLHGSRAGVGGAGGTEGVRAAVEGIRECAARRPAV